VGRNFQRADHHCSNSVGVARSEVSADGGRGPAAKPSPDLRRGRHHRAFHRNQDHRHPDYPHGACIKEMAMKKNLITATLMTIATTILLGVIYPLVITGLAQLIFPRQANGQLILKDGKLIGSSIIAQGFSSPGYFHPRPSFAGNGYDPTNTN